MVSFKKKNISYLIEKKERKRDQRDFEREHAQYLRDLQDPTTET